MRYPTRPTVLIAATLSAMSPPVASQSVVPQAVDSQTVEEVQTVDTLTTPADTVTVTAEPVTSGAPVVINGDTVLVLYGSLGALSAADRAESVISRFERYVGNPEFRADSMVIVEEQNQILIVLAGSPVMEVLEDDASGANLPRSVLAVSHRDALQAAYARATSVGRAATVWRGVGAALLATLVALGLAWLFRQLVLRARRLLGLLRASKRLPSISIQGLELISADRIASAGLAALGVVRVMAWGALAYFYVVFVLSLFSWSRPLSERILGYVTTPLGAVGSSLLGYLPNLFFIAVIVIVTRWVIQVVKFVFDAIGRGRLVFAGFDREWAVPTYKLVRFLVLAFGLVVLFPYLPGSGSDAFKGVSLFMGLLFSLGSTGAVANLVSGTLLTYTRSFNVGDTVRIGETFGEVIARTLLVTRIRTLSNVEVAIPNSQVMSGHVLNYSTHAESDGIALQASVTIGYDVSWRTVHELLLSAARKTDGIADSPEPFVLQKSLEDSYPSYELNAFTHDAKQMRVTVSNLNSMVQDCFAAAGVEITSPIYLATRDGGASTVPQAEERS